MLSIKGERTPASTSSASKRHKKTRAIAEGELQDGEELITVCLGQSKQAMIVTDRRILIVKPGVMAGASLGAKLGSFPLEDISTINLHTGVGVAALEVVVAGQDKPDKPNLRRANQLSNWLPCHPKIKKSPFVRELRAYVQSDGRARSARDALRDSEISR